MWYRGKTTRPTSVTSNPSRASSVAAVDPAGPPPITRTCVELFILLPLSLPVEGNGSLLAHAVAFSQPGKCAYGVVPSTIITSFILCEKYALAPTYMSRNDP